MEVICIICGKRRDADFLIGVASKWFLPIMTIGVPARIRWVTRLVDPFIVIWRWAFLQISKESLVPIN